MEYFAMLNISLCVFNLIPMPPLDGSRLLAVLLPENAFAAFRAVRPGAGDDTHICLLAVSFPHQYPTLLNIFSADFITS
jgi:membrane-associated protease RseP (regulator of RpoE activity)